ncbi:UDPglucose--hexose-1-phosphate uridylyltransferase [Quadrisphaera granulorum]|uniref:Galactose-1-phosphate uridylyltransferase n=1 Tax=Quadrisphaera granulorum TaxID=317664 RepID=A0A316ABS3_9ACTN|nr:galactose-1-phosphate uridylyltransferase [Quadrisphaera granulorum]PWJ47277.1 UDPglucose--hexose-1-phosphate uridylyltransferase [Quadrisphaera granulorum]SZE98848.1 UDPglucose--hexose-1-phosphate uridylyltransferase [Quadrisphaera granulorum]
MAQVRRTDRQMADGRPIHYYDDTEPWLSGASTRSAVDTRDLPSVATTSTMRWDVLTGEWVAHAAHRQDRTFMPPADLCPLCPARPGREPGEVPEADYDVVVFSNRFPSYAGAGTSLAEEPAGLVDGEPLWPVRAAVGQCEVVCFTADHSATFASLPVSRVRTVVEAWADRTAELSSLSGVAGSGEVFVFENRGKEIGVTLQHPHGQIYAYPEPTPRTSQLIVQASRHQRAHGTSLLADVLAAEQRAGTRVVLRGEHWTAYVPAAARWPVEFHLAPHRDVPDLAALDAGERDELAVVYSEMLGRLDRYFDGVDALPYIAGWHQAPLGRERELGRLHLQAFSVLRQPGKLKYLAGSESGVGAWINDTTPERIADRLREVAS